MEACEGQWRQHAAAAELLAIKKRHSAAVAGGGQQGCCAAAAAAACSGVLVGSGAAVTVAAVTVAAVAAGGVESDASDAGAGLMAAAGNAAHPLRAGGVGKVPAGQAGTTGKAEQAGGQSEPDPDDGWTGERSKITEHQRSTALPAVQSQGLTRPRSLRRRQWPGIARWHPILGRSPAVETQGAGTADAAGQGIRQRGLGSTEAAAAGAAGESRASEGSSWHGRFCLAMHQRNDGMKATPILHPSPPATQTPVGAAAVAGPSCCCCRCCCGQVRSAVRRHPSSAPAAGQQHQYSQFAQMGMAADQKQQATQPTTRST